MARTWWKTYVSTATKKIQNNLVYSNLDRSEVNVCELSLCIFSEPRTLRKCKILHFLFIWKYNFLLYVLLKCLNNPLQKKKKLHKNYVFYALDVITAKIKK